MRRWVFLISLLACSVSHAETEQPPFETPDPAISENFRTIFYAVDNLTSDMTSSLAEYLPLAGGTMTGDIDLDGNFLTNLTSATANHHAARFSQVKIIQVVMGTSATGFGTTSTSFVSTNLSAAITPSSTSSKILVLAFGTGGNTTANQESHYTLARDTTSLSPVSGGFVRVTSAAAIQAPAVMAYLDSPSTTSSTTYRVRMQVTGGTGVFGGSNNFTQVMILMEVNGL